MPIVSVDGELSEVCAVDMELTFEAGIGTSLSGSYTEEDLGLEIGSDGDVETKVRLRGIAITAEEGISDFSFVESLWIAVESAEAGELEPLEVAELENSPALGDMDAWYLESATDADLAAYLDGRPLRFHFELTGIMPDAPWAVHLDACFAVHGGYRRDLEDLGL